MQGFLCPRQIKDGLPKIVGWYHARVRKDYSGGSSHLITTFCNQCPQLSKLQVIDGLLMVPIEKGLLRKKLRLAIDGLLKHVHPVEDRCVSSCR